MVSTDWLIRNDVAKIVIKIITDTIFTLPVFCYRQNGDLYSNNCPAYLDDHFYTEDGIPSLATTRLSLGRSAQKKKMTEAILPI